MLGVLIEFWETLLDNFILRLEFLKKTREKMLG